MSVNPFNPPGQGTPTSQSIGQTAIQQNLSVTVEGRSQCYFPYNAREQVYYLVINNS